MTQPELNWLDKTIIALAELSVEETRVMIHVMKFALGMSFGLSLIFVLATLKTLGIIGSLSLGFTSPYIPTIFLFVFFYSYSSQVIQRKKSKRLSYLATNVLFLEHWD